MRIATRSKVQAVPVREPCQGWNKRWVLLHTVSSRRAVAVTQSAAWTQRTRCPQGSVCWISKQATWDSHYSKIASGVSMPSCDTWRSQSGSGRRERVRRIYPFSLRLSKAHAMATTTPNPSAVLLCTRRSNIYRPLLPATDAVECGGRFVLGSGFMPGLTNQPTAIAAADIVSFIFPRAATQYDRDTCRLHLASVQSSPARAPRSTALQSILRPALRGRSFFALSSLGK